MQGQGRGTERIKKRKKASLEIRNMLNTSQDDKGIREIYKQWKINGHHPKQVKGSNHLTYDIH